MTMCSIVMKELFRLGPETVCFKLQSDVPNTPKACEVAKVRLERPDEVVEVTEDHCLEGKTMFR